MSSPSAAALKSTAREKILRTADELFYDQGVRAVGVDTIVEHSGVAKTSLYRWFPTKDDLVAAYLTGRNERFWAQWHAVAERHKTKPADELAAQLSWIARYVTSRDYRGCPFISLAAEFRDVGHPGRAVCQENKQMLQAALRALTSRLGVSDPDALADQLLLLIDGAFSNAQVLGTASPARHLAAAGQALIGAALAAGETG